MWFYIRMMRTLWTDQRHNEKILKEVNPQREVVTRGRRRQSTIFGYAMRWENCSMSWQQESWRERCSWGEQERCCLTVWHHDMIEGLDRE